MPPKIPQINHLKELSLVSHIEKFPIIYFDTSFVLKTLVDGLEYHNECVQFIQDLKNFQPVIIYSEVLREELWCANLIREIKDLHKIQHLNIRKFMKLYPNTPRCYHPKTVDINKKFDELLGNFSYRESIPLTHKITSEALDLIHKYNLLGVDAIHIATMFHNHIERCNNIAVFDNDIEDIKDVTVWTVNGVDKYINNHYKEWGFRIKPLSN
ncbi:MAG: type II toxin-antitoxin system VapC family toxin [Candidatus Omnitrophota bacterium]